MRHLAVCILFLCAAPAVAHAQMHIKQNIRDVALDPKVNVHAVEVVGAQSITTSIRLPVNHLLHLQRTIVLLKSRRGCPPGGPMRPPWAERLANLTKNVKFARCSREPCKIKYLAP